MSRKNFSVSPGRFSEKRPGHGEALLKILGICVFKEALSNGDVRMCVGGFVFEL